MNLKNSMHKKQKKFKISDFIRLTAAAVSISCILYLSATVGEYMIQNKENDEVRQAYELSETVMPSPIAPYFDSTGNSDDASIPDESANLASEVNSPISQSYAVELYMQQPFKQYDHTGLSTQNSDYRLWLDIPGTSISYPVVQSHTNTDYLSRTFEGKRRASGAIFIDANITDIDEARNLLIHGHNMKSGSMFGTLPSYKNLSFYNKHPFVYLYLPNETRVYQVISAYTMPHNAKEEETYQDTFENDEEFKAFVDRLIQKSVIKTEVPIDYDRQILTLSTCVNKSTARFVVHAIRYN